MKKKVLKDVNNVPMSTIIGRSQLINNILCFAEHNYIDLIVMSTKGASGIKKALVGSVAAKIVQRTDIPVLLIPEKYKRTESFLLQIINHQISRPFPLHSSLENFIMGMSQ